MKDRRFRWIGYSTACVLTAAALPAMADDISWVAGNGDFLNPANWGGTAPGGDDNALVNNGATATLDDEGNTTEVGSLQLGQAGEQRGHVVVQAGTLSLLGPEVSRIGAGGSVASSLSVAGDAILTSGANVFVGVGGGIGNVVLDADSAVNIAGVFRVGGSGEGSVFGGNGLPGGGTNPTGTGSVTIQGGNHAFGDFHIGGSGNGSAVMNGGTVSVSGVNGVRLGYHAGSTGTFELNDGLIVLPTGEDFAVGQWGHGEFTMNGGELRTGWVIVGNENDSTGVFNMNGGVINQQEGDFELGDAQDTGGVTGVNAVGTMNLSGGRINVSGFFAVSQRRGEGYLNISGGILDAAAGDNTGGQGLWIGRDNDGNATSALGELRITGGDADIWLTNFVMDRSAGGGGVTANLIAELTGPEFSTIRSRFNVDIEFGNFAVELGDGFVPSSGMEFIIARANDALDDIEGDDQPRTTGALDGLVLFNEDTIFKSVDYSQAVLPAGLSWELEIRNDEFEFPVEVVLKVIGELEFILGDMNGDGALDAFDVAPFELALADRDAYAAQFPDIDPDVRGDFDGMGGLDAFDVSGFEVALAGSGGAVPEPASLALVGIGMAAMMRRRRA